MFRINYFRKTSGSRTIWEVEWDAGPKGMEWKFYLMVDVFISRRREYRNKLCVQIVCVYSCVYDEMSFVVGIHNGRLRWNDMGESQRDCSSQWGEKRVEATAVAEVAFQKQFTYSQPCRCQIGGLQFLSCYETVSRILNQLTHLFVLPFAEATRWKKTTTMDRGHLTHAIMAMTTPASFKPTTTAMKRMTRQNRMQIESTFKPTVWVAFHHNFASDRFDFWTVNASSRRHQDLHRHRTMCWPKAYSFDGIYQFVNAIAANTHHTHSEYLSALLSTIVYKISNEMTKSWNSVEKLTRVKHNGKWAHARKSNFLCVCECVCLAAYCS